MQNRGNSRTKSTKLIDAVRQGSDREAIRNILEEGVDINEGDSIGYTALHWAAANIHPDIVELLLANGANPFVQNQWFNTALNVARHKECRQILTKHISKIFLRELNSFEGNDKKFESKFKPVTGYKEMLLEHILAMPDTKERIIHLLDAKENKESGIYRFFHLKRGPNEVSEKTMGSCLWRLSRVLKREQRKIAKEIVEAINEDNINKIDELFPLIFNYNYIHQKCLHHALKTNKLNAFAKLVEMGANPNRRRFKASLITTLFNQLEKIDLKSFIQIAELFSDQALSEMKLNIYSDSSLFGVFMKDTHLLNRAAFHHRVDIIEYLVTQRGMDINKENIRSETVMHVAAFRNDIDMMTRLVELGADIKGGSSHAKHAPLSIAVHHNNKSAIAFLTSHNKTNKVEEEKPRLYPQFESSETEGVVVTARLVEEEAPPSYEEAVQAKIIERLERENAALQHQLYLSQANAGPTLFAAPSAPATNPLVHQMPDVPPATNPLVRQLEALNAPYMSKPPAQKYQPVKTTKQMSYAQ